MSTNPSDIIINIYNVAQYTTAFIAQIESDFQEKNSNPKLIFVIILKQNPCYNMNI